MASETKFKETEIGMVPEEWTIDKLGNNIKVLTDYHANGSYETLKKNVALLDEPNYAIMIRTTNFEKNCFNSDFKYISIKAYEFLKKSSVFPNDILMNKIANAGSVYLMPDLKKPVSLAMNLFLIRIEGNLNQEFVYWFLKHNERYVKSRAQGSVTKTITKENVRNLLIAYPKKDEQDAIVGVLKSYKEKIELNQQVNSTLEQIAQALFKHWFIDFEFPDENGNSYKSSGGRMADSELGEIPEGWRAGNILDFADLLSGGTPKTSISEYWDGGIPWVSAKDVTSSNGTFILTTEKTITQKGIERSNAKLLPKYTTVVTARGTVGNVCILSREMAINQTNYGLKSKYDHGDFFLFITLLNLIQDMKQNAYGTVFDTITTKTFRQIQITLPPIRLIEYFEDVVGNLMHKVLSNLEESQNLCSIRDSLLPKLMSGKIRVQT